MVEPFDPDTALTEVQARKLLSKILREGEVVFAPHARKEMADDAMVEQDVFNVLRAGRIHEPAELENESWRYRVHTERFCVVVAFDSLTLTIVVTAWRKK